MGDPFAIEMAKARQEELLREAEWRRIARALRGFRRGEGDDEGLVQPEGLRERWRLGVGRPSEADSGRGPLHGTLRS